MEAEHPPRTRKLDIAPSLEVEEHTNPHVRASNRFTRLLSLSVAGGFSIITLGSVAVAYEKLRDVAKDAGVEGAKVVVGDIEVTKRKVEVVDVDLQMHKADEARERLEVKGELHDVRVELRELYKAQMEGKRSAVLERPVPPAPKDGGRP